MENEQVSRTQPYDKEEKFESFALRSGLIDEKKLFSERDLEILYSGLVKMRTMDDDLTKDDLSYVEKFENLILELNKKDKIFDFLRFFGSMENALERE